MSALSTMEKRVKLETRHMEPKEVIELILDNCRAQQIEGLTEQYTELEVLSMINLGLTTLKGFPVYPKLKRLEISDNKISDGLEYLKVCPNIATLKICNNRIVDIATLAPLKYLKNLVSLDLIECPIADDDKYRAEVFEAIPQLTFLDGIDREGQAEPDSDEDFDLDEEEDEMSGLESEDEEGSLGEEGEEEEEEEEEDDEEDEEDSKPNGVEKATEEEGGEPVAKKRKLSEGDAATNGATEATNGATEEPAIPVEDDAAPEFSASTEKLKEKSVEAPVAEDCKS